MFIVKQKTFAASPQPLRYPNTASFWPLGRLTFATGNHAHFPRRYCDLPSMLLPVEGRLRLPFPLKRVEQTHRYPLTG